MKDCKNFTGLVIFGCCFMLLCVLLYTGKEVTTIDKVLALVTLVATSAITGVIGKPAKAEEVPAEEQTEEVSGDENGQ